MFTKFHNWIRNNEKNEHILYKNLWRIKSENFLAFNLVAILECFSIMNFHFPTSFVTFWFAFEVSELWLFSAFELFQINKNFFVRFYDKTKRAKLAQAKKLENWNFSNILRAEKVLFFLVQHEIWNLTH